MKIFLSSVASFYKYLFNEIVEKSELLQNGYQRDLRRLTDGNIYVRKVAISFNLVKLIWRRSYYNKGIKLKSFKNICSWGNVCLNIFITKS